VLLLLDDELTYLFLEMVLETVLRWVILLLVHVSMSSQLVFGLLEDVLGYE
jgi:hypothetical protein